MENFLTVDELSEKERKKLEELALEKVRLLNEIEKEVFDFSIFNGAITPKNPKYWDINGKYTHGFLRFHP
jgi:restriction endonuclease S subunit